MKSNRRVKRKETFKSYEAGGGSLYIPLISDLFPKWFKHEPKEKLKYFIITSDTKYRVEEKVYHRLEVGDHFNPQDSYYA